jgi:hypothetical protein
MKNPGIRHGRKELAALFLIWAFASSSAWATIVTWSLNPSGTEGDAGSTNQTFSSSGYDLTAYGYTLGYPNTPLGLYFKTSGTDLPGLGVTATSDHELQGNGWYPTTFIQLDVSSLLAQGFTEGQVQVGNISGSDSFAIWGSSSLGDRGQQIGDLYTTSSNLNFISIADFSSYDYLAIGAVTGGVLPVAFQATFAPIPEIGALFPIIGLIVAIAITQILRRRRIAQLRASSPSTH